MQGCYSRVTLPSLEAPQRMEGVKAKFSVKVENHCQKVRYPEYSGE
jgi:hypothetical protein